MPNEVRQDMTSKSPTSSSQSQPQSAVSTGPQPKPTTIPTTAPGRVEPKRDIKNAGTKKPMDDDKPLELVVEQKTS